LQSKKLNGNLLRISLAVALLCLLVVGAKMRGQEKADMTVHVKVVNVPATVRDKHGKIVTNLTKDDFVLEEDGRPQTLRYFSQDNNLPLTLGMLVDTSMSQRRVLGQERTASSSFIDQMLRPEKDKAFLIHFDHEVELDQDLTNSREKLRSALDTLQAPQFTQTSGGNPSGQGSGGYPGGRGGGHRDGASHGGGTLLYDAIYLASDELMKKQTGRKALIVLSDGDDRGSKETLLTAIETAQRADTIIYSILFKDDEDRGFGGGFGGIGMGGHRGGMGGGRSRYWNRCRVRQAAGCLKFQASRPSRRFTRRLKKTCATNTALDTRRTGLIQARACIRSASRRNRRTLWSMRERNITGNTKAFQTSSNSRSCTNE
jgi:VWFA-related protein